MSAFPDVSPEAPPLHPIKVGGTLHLSKGILIAYLPPPHPPHSYLPLRSLEVGTKGHRTRLGSPLLQGLRDLHLNLECGASWHQLPSERSNVPFGHPVRKALAPLASLTPLATSPSLSPSPAPAQPSPYDRTQSPRVHC